MDELEFESRLGARLHRRFGAAAPSPELRAAIDQVLSTRPQPIGLAALHSRRREIGWAAVVAAGLIVAIALTGGRLGGPFGPGTPSTPPASPGPISTWRDFIVLPPAGSGPDKGEQLLASDVLFERLRALLFTGPNQNFSGGGGYALTYQIPPGGPSDESIRTVLRAAGDVRFMALTTLPGVIGQNPPDDATLQFGRDGILSAAFESPFGPPVLSMTLRPEAAEAFAAFSAAHVGETFAIVIDDDIALLPTINEPITDGTIQVSGGGLPGSEEATNFLEAAAIIIGGRLPDSWILPIVPELVSPSDIAARMELEFSKVEPIPPANVDIRITEASLTSVLEGTHVVAVWYIKLDGLAAACPSPLPSDERGSCRWTDPQTEHVFDAETGEWLGIAEDFAE